MNERAKIFLRPALLLAGLVGAGLLLRLLPEGGVSGLLAREAAEHTAGGALDLIMVGAAVCAVGVPRQAVAYACGLALGVRYGVCAAMAAQLAACAANLFWARLVGRDWATRRLSGRLAKLDRAIAARPFSVTVSLRLLPVGSNLLLNLAAGVSSVAALPFLAASAVGFLPQTLVFALAGSGSQVGQGEHLLLAGLLLVISAGLGWWLLRRSRGTELGGLEPAAVSADAARSAIRQG